MEGYLLVQLETPFGFMQDLMILAIIDKTTRYIEVQSQLRVGLKDYGLNTANVQGML